MAPFNQEKRKVKPTKFNFLAKRLLSQDYQSVMLRFITLIVGIRLGIAWNSLRAGVTELKPNARLSLCVDQLRNNDGDSTPSLASVRRGRGLHKARLSEICEACKGCH